MWILLLEAGVALFLLIFIVWWTMSGKKPDHPAKQPEPLPKPEPLEKDREQELNQASEARQPGPAGQE